MTTENIIANITAFVKDFPIKRTDVETARVPMYPVISSMDGPNMSTAFTWLIQAAGKCRFYASDIVYDILAINDTIEAMRQDIRQGKDPEPEILYIGIRDMGVDGNSFIHSKIAQDGCYNLTPDKFAAYYSALFRVTVAEADCYGEKCIRITTEEFDLSFNQNRESA